MERQIKFLESLFCFRRNLCHFQYKMNLPVLLKVTLSVFQSSDGKLLQGPPKLCTETSINKVTSLGISFSAPGSELQSRAADAAWSLGPSDNGMHAKRHAVPVVYIPFSADLRLGSRSNLVGQSVSYNNIKYSWSKASMWYLATKVQLFYRGWISNYLIPIQWWPTTL